MTKWRIFISFIYPNFNIINNSGPPRQEPPKRERGKICLHIPSVDRHLLVIMASARPVTVPL